MNLSRRSLLSHITALIIDTYSAIHIFSFKVEECPDWSALLHAGYRSCAILKHRGSLITARIQIVGRLCSQLLMYLCASSSIPHQPIISSHFSNSMAYRIVRRSRNNKTIHKGCTIEYAFGDCFVYDTDIRAIMEAHLAINYPLTKLTTVSMCVTT